MMNHLSPKRHKRRIRHFFLSKKLVKGKDDADRRPGAF
jgi:hypothetical protein